MNYLLLMYHLEDYWNTRTDERDEHEEAAFAEFCAWMGEMGITWTSHALQQPKASLVRKISVQDATNGLLQEIVEVITGYFEISIPHETLVEDVMDRCPHIGGTRVELRAMSE